MKLMMLLIYGFLLSISLFVIALVWHWQMPGSYFVSPAKGLISDFLPPFVDGSRGDYFIRPKHVVYLMWGVYVGLATVVPAVLAWLIARVYERALKKSWM
jgi:hypothetical protein